jgi:hypothetical protein
MTRARSFLLLASLAAPLVLAGCESFDPTAIFDSDIFDTKKKLQGERRPSWCAAIRLLRRRKQPNRFRNTPLPSPPTPKPNRSRKQSPRQSRNRLPSRRSRPPLPRRDRQPRKRNRPLRSRVSPPVHGRRRRNLPAASRGQNRRRCGDRTFRAPSLRLRREGDKPLVPSSHRFATQLL